MSRNLHIARDRITRLQIVIPNFYMVTGVETAAGAATSVTASIEYPAGTFTQILFSGVATGSIADKSYLISDFVSVNIPQGATFYTRIWRSNSTAIVFTTGTGYPSATGDGFVSSTTTTPDLTMSGSVTQSTINVFAPIAILAYTGRRNVAILGDSQGFGTGETVSEGTWEIGYAPRSIGPVAGYMNLATPSDAINLFVASSGANSVNRRAIAAYSSDMVWIMGTNDIAGGRTSGQIATDFATALAYFPNQRHWICTVPPRTTSTDSWVTTGNQTVTANESVRIVVNTNIRACGIATQVGCFDIADAIESSHNSGLWSIDTAGASPARTADGIHPASIGHRQIAQSGKIEKAVFLPHN